MILVIDNYDSFTWNLVQLLGELDPDVEVRRNDEVTVAEIEALGPERIVISPGPCTPAEAGISVELVRRLGPGVPILGVCLGHQAVGAAFGARIVRAARLMHGKVSAVEHYGTGIFAGLPNPLRVTRYHSLELDGGSVPPELCIEARTAETGWESEIQAVRHADHPIWGVQFHPESIASQAGRELLANFVALN